jgi:maltose O-acetyltransferase
VVNNDILAKIKRSVLCALYYGFARRLPVHYLPGGKFGKFLRYQICKRLFKKCGKNANIESMAHFNTGRDVSLGEDSDIGVNCRIYGDVIIGNHVMMGIDVIIFSRNHKFSDIDIPMNKQGFTERKCPVIGDDVWIGARVIILPGVHIGNGAVIGAGSVVTKDVPEWAVVAGNPAKLIRSRKT